MRYIRQHIETILQNYKGNIPLAHFLKQYYRANPKLGSRDRKILSDMAYSWFRFSNYLSPSLNAEEKIQSCLFVCETSTPHVLSFLPKEWPDKAMLNLHQRIHFLQEQNISITKLSAAPSWDLSAGITKDDWLESLWQQPDFFIRIRKNKETVFSLLEQNEIPFCAVNNNCIALSNSSPVDKILPPETYVVQDLSSQMTGSFFNPVNSEEHWWDCCAGAGGKSLLLKDKMPSVQLTVSDERASILHNLRSRFDLYHLTRPVQFVLDLTRSSDLKNALDKRRFDHVICDVPCTGSGTWARTPEQFYFFKKETITDFAKRQKAIAVNASAYLKPGGTFFYITCSVFKEENEEVITHLLQETDLQLKERHLLNGVSQKADSMFIALLRKP